MTRFTRFGAFASVACLAAASAVAASTVATVESANGKVLVNRASTYNPATQGMPLEVGDRVVVLEGGSASVRFSTDCVRLFDKSTVYTVTAESPCQPAAADRGLRSPVPASTPAATGAGSGVAWGEYAKWGVVALGVITPIVVLATDNQGNQGNQTSP
jgi:hypothetical protein